MAADGFYNIPANPKLKAEMATDGVWTPHVSVEGNVTLDVSHVEIGGVFIQDETSGDSAQVDANGALLITVGNGTVPVSALALPLPDGASTSANQTTIITALGNISTVQLLQATAANQVLEIASLSSLDGKTVAVNTGAIAFAAPQHVILDSGNATISGAVTVTSGNITATLAAGSAVIGHVIVDTAPVTHVIIDSSPELTVTGPLTDTELRATPVPVSGTITATVADATIASGNISVPNLELTQGSDFTDTVGPMVQGVVSDTPESWIGGEIRPISITSEGRVRVSTLPAYTEFDFFSMAGQVASTIWSVPNPWGI